MAIDIMRFLQGVNSYNTGERAAGIGARNPFERMFRSPREVIDERSISNQTEDDRTRLRNGVESLASQMPPPGGGADGFGNPEIIVQNRPLAGGNRVDPVLGAPPPMGNRDWIEEVSNARENAPGRKGMFGMKGTLRDVVGILGDAFLVQGGGKAIYGPQRQLEKKSDAIIGMTGGIERTPENEAYLAAIERMAYEDPVAADEMFKQFETMGLNRAVKENQIAQRTATTDKNRNEVLLKNRSQLQRLLSNTPPEMRAQAIARYAPLLARQAGVDMEELGVYQGMTPQEIEAFANSDMNVFQSEQIPLRERSVASQEKNAQSNAIRAARPPAGPRPVQPSEGAVKGAILGKVARGEKLTPGEREIYESTRSKGKGGRRQPPALPPGFRIPN